MTTTLVRNRTSARMVDVPRVVPFMSVRSASGGGEPGDGRTLDGFASVFNELTRIEAWEGTFKEQFLTGSMKRSFREHTPIIQFDHGRHAMIGSIPVAAFERGYPVEEVDAERAPNGGARVLARMHQAPLFEPVREAISTGTINGMSIRFFAVKEKWYWPDGRQVKDTEELNKELLRTWFEDVPDEELLRRDIVEASVSEMGPVVWPAYATTSVGVRSVLDSLSADQRRQFIREVAAQLRDDPELKALIAASGARSTDGEEPDGTRQAAAPSPAPDPIPASRRQKADEQALRLRGISLGKEGTTS